MPASRPSTAEVTVLAGGESLRVSGRAAAIIGVVAAHADRLNAIPVGKLIANLGQGQLKVDLVESLATIRLESQGPG